MAYDMKRVALIDDDKYVCSVTSKVLRRLGYNVDTFFDGKSAIDGLRKNKYHVAIIDFNLGNGITGPDIIRALDGLPNTVKILFTGYLNNNEVMQESRGYFDYFWSKPIKPADMISVLGTLK